MVEGDRCCGICTGDRWVVRGDRVCEVMGAIAVVGVRGRSLREVVRAIAGWWNVDGDRFVKMEKGDRWWWICGGDRWWWICGGDRWWWICGGDRWLVEFGKAIAVEENAIALLQVMMRGAIAEGFYQ